MDVSIEDSPLSTARQFDTIADALIDKGYIVCPQLLPDVIIDELCQRVRELDHHEYHFAGVGREEQQQVNTAVRRDLIHWLDHRNPQECDYLIWMNHLREELNRRLFMGLFDYEAHFAHYPSGAFYKRHYDAFQGRTNRVLTTVLYLNDNWLPTDGGDMLLYPKDSDLNSEVQPQLTVSPEKGTLVIFLSQNFPHEVTTALNDRYSIAGWFRVNGSVGNHIDPPR